MRILGGLMALGYEIGTIMKRNSIIHSDDRLTIKLDTIEGMGHGFVQVRHHYCNGWGALGGGGGVEVQLLQTVVQ